MVTKQALHQLVEGLEDADVDTASRLLRALTRHSALSTGGVGSQKVDPAPPIESIDALRAAFWPADEPPELFETTIRRWRESDHRD